jgi:Na+-driven multidrug efflux pump
MNALNVIFNYMILYGPVSFRWKGTTGIAVANVCARTLSLLLGFLFLGTSHLGLQLRHKNLRTLTCIGRILRIGVPGGVSNLSYSLSQVVSTSILAVLGTTALTAKIYVSSIVFYVYVVGYSLGLATAILMGWMTGAGQYERAYVLNQQILRFAVSLNVILSVVIYLFHKPLMGLFTKNPEIIQMTGIIFFIDILVEFGRAFNHVENNSLTGAGDVMFPMVISIISAWGISILFSYILGIKMGYGLAGCWVAFAMDELFRGLIFFHRFRSKKWMRMHV